MHPSSCVESLGSLELIPATVLQSQVGQYDSPLQGHNYLKMVLIQFSFGKKFSKIATLFKMHKQTAIFSLPRS